MPLRVIGGEHRGRVLQSLPGTATRPLLGQVKEALFNILGARVDGAEVWDLFAGTGASGIEALSRGAARVLFCEKSNQALRVLRANLDQFGPEFKELTHALKVDAWDPPPLMPEGEAEEVAPDLVFFDPPYAAVKEDPVRSVVKATALCGRLAEGGVLVFHFPEGCLEEDDFDAALECDFRTWGTSTLAILQRPNPNGSDS